MLIAAAVFAGAGQMNIAMIFVVAVIAAVIGDNHRALRPLRLFDPAVARFIDGLRQVNGLLAGMVGMHWLKFLSYNALGAALWVGTWCAVGYLAGEHIVEIYDTFERYKWYVVAAVVVVGAIVITHRVRRRRAERAA